MKRGILVSNNRGGAVVKTFMISASALHFCIRILVIWERLGIQLESSFFCQWDRNIRKALQEFTVIDKRSRKGLWKKSRV